MKAILRVVIEIPIQGENLQVADALNNVRSVLPPAFGGFAAGATWVHGAGRPGRITEVTYKEQPEPIEGP